MVDVNTKGVQGAFERLSQAALVKADSDRNCTVNADDLSTLLMAFTILRLRDQPKPNSIICPKCQRESFHPKDIEYKHCIACGFHSDLDQEE